VSGKRQETARTRSVYVKAHRRDAHCLPSKELPTPVGLWTGTARS
jgi:hypothetical protein